MEFSVPYRWVQGPGVGTVQRRFFQSNYVEPTEWSREHLAPWIDAPEGLEQALDYFHPVYAGQDGG